MKNLDELDERDKNKDASGRKSIIGLRRKEWDGTM